LIGASGRSMRLCHSLWRVSSVTPYQNTPTAISSIPSTTTTFPRKPSSCVSFMAPSPTNHAAEVDMAYAGVGRRIRFQHLSRADGQAATDAHVREIADTSGERRVEHVGLVHRTTIVQPHTRFNQTRRLVCRDGSGATLCDPPPDLFHSVEIPQKRWSP